MTRETTEQLLARARERHRRFRPPAPPRSRATPPAAAKPRPEAGRARLAETRRRREGGTPAPTPVDLTARRALAGALKLVKAAARVGRADDATIAARKAVCESCPHLKLITPTVNGVPTGAAYTGCALCGCRFKAKLSLAAESCPDAPPRWGPVTPKP